MKKIFLALAILTIVIIFPVSAADSEFLEDSGLNYVDFTYSGVDTSISTIPRDILINNVINWTDISSVYVRATLYGTYYAASTPENYYEPVNFLVGEDVIGSGYAGYNLFSPPDDTTRLIYGQFWVDIDDIDFSGYVGKQFIKIVPIEGDLYNNIIVRALPHSTTLPPDNQFPVVFGHQIDSGKFSGVYGLHISRAEYDWKNRIEITDDAVKIVRNYDGIAYYSIINISTPADSVIEAGYNDITLRYVGHPVMWTVTSPQNKVFTGIYNPDTGGSSAPVTVYIRNSQTGSAIANSRCIIDALVDGDYYPVVNRTEPSGIFSVTLQPTGGGLPNPDGYRLIASADGYNNPMPEINFTVDEYTTSIYCYLDPITGGPLDENKTFIDFFVRDMSANPISGATINFGGYTLLTNSQGYTVFEVGKNDTYTYTVSKSGYGSLTGNVVIGADPRHTINTVLAPAVTPTIPTAIPTSTSISPTPTMTAPTGEPVSNWLDWFAAHFGMILGGGVEIGKIFMWLCFAVPVGVYVGKEAKAGAAGFMAGAGIVTLFFVLIGWVPIWLLVLLALIIGLLYAKVFNNSDNGGGR